MPMNAVALSTRGYICPMVSLSTVIPLAPAEAQSLLVKALSVPLPPSMTEALGIHQSDVIIRSALVAGLANLRAEPWLLDYVFASLPKDRLTMSDYGEKEVAQAKAWFMKTDIPVFMDYRDVDGKLPCISIQLLESSEAESTLGDVHYVTQEETEAKWPVVYGPFNPEAYSPSTGIMKLPTIDQNQLILSTDLYVVDKIGRSHQIEEVIDGNGVIKIKAGTVADFSSSTLRHKKPLLITQLESVSFRETYRIGCHVGGDPVYLTYLHSIVTFLLLAYKEVLLEARGFERSVLSSSDFVRNPNLDVELAYSRFVTITGYVRNYWPKATKGRIQGIESALDMDANKDEEFMFDIENTSGIGVK